MVVSLAESEPVDFGASVASELAAICDRAMARDPADRFEPATALRDAIAEHLGYRSSMELVTEGEGALDALRSALAGALESERGIATIQTAAPITRMSAAGAARTP